MAKVSGKTGSFTLNGNPVRVTKWEGTHEKTFIETTDTGSNGVQQGIVGIESLNGTMEGFIDSVDLADDIKPESQGILILQVSTGLEYSIADAIVDMNKISVDVKGAVAFSGTFKSNGIVTQLA
jgi:hypothetical protein